MSLTIFFFPLICNVVRQMVAALCHRGDCIYLMHSSVMNARSALCKVCMFRSPLRGESHLEDSENKLCSEYKSPCARQDEWFYINYCSNTTFVEPVISSLYTVKARTPVLGKNLKSIYNAHKCYKM